MNLSDIIRRNLLVLILAFAGLVLLGFGLFQVFTASKSSSDLKFEPASSVSAAPKSDITVDVEGAVMSPGVYKVADNSRVVDALAKAGGMSAEADRDSVSKNMNLARKVVD